MKNVIMVVMLATLCCGIANGKPLDKHYVKPINANVYVKSDKTQVKIILGKGRKVIELDRKGGLVLIHIDKTGGIQGWISKSDLSSTDCDGFK